MKQLTFIVLFSLFFLFWAYKSHSSNEKYNVIFILADDFGWNQVGYNGTTFYETPNIDKLASEGVRFTNAYAANPVCSPTRASIMTGKNPARLHITDYIPSCYYPYAYLNAPPVKPGLSLNEYTLAELFKNNGYKTGHFGKWHLSKDKNYKKGREQDPDTQGFDDVFTSVKPSKNADPNKDAHHAIEITNRAIKFIEENQNKPFFCYIPHHVVHTPLLEKPTLVNKYEQKPDANTPVNNPVMGAMIETMDNCIGRVMDKLDELELSEKTIVVFFSDNGGLESMQDQAPLRGGKAMIYEGGIHVPMLIKWPNKIKANTINSGLFISDDFFATFADLLGDTDIPKDIDSKSILPALLKGENTSRDTLCFHYPIYHHLGYLPAGAIRVGNYKLIEWFEGTVGKKGDAYSLYNLSTDKSESNNIADQNPRKVKEMSEALKNWRLRIGAQQMTMNPFYDQDLQKERISYSSEENRATIRKIKQKRGIEF